MLSVTRIYVYNASDLNMCKNYTRICRVISDICLNLAQLTIRLTITDEVHDT